MDWPWGAASVYPVNLSRSMSAMCPGHALMAWDWCPGSGWGGCSEPHAPAETDPLGFSECGDCPPWACSFWGLWKLCLQKCFKRSDLGSCLRHRHSKKSRSSTLHDVSLDALLLKYHLGKREMIIESPWVAVWTIPGLLLKGSACPCLLASAVPCA